MSGSNRSDVIIRVPPYHYIHVLDSNTNVVRLVLGPSTYTRPEHEKVVEGPTKMLTLPPRHYLVVLNPCMRDPVSKDVLFDVHGMVRLKHGDVEIRTPSAFPDPFPLYPGEELEGSFHKFRVIEVNQALKLHVIRDFDESGKLWRAGDEFLFKGPGTYLPRVEVEERGMVNAIVVTHSKALLLRAKNSTKDSAGLDRKAGEEWLHREVGAYLPSIDEELVETRSAVTLTEQKALHVRAKKTFLDAYGKRRKAGEEWLVTVNDAESHIPDVYEEVVGTVELTTLTSRQYCVVLNPYSAETGEQRLGGREVRVGESSFFLRPNEMLENGIEDVYILADDEALLLQATEAFEDASATDESDHNRQPGDRWLVRGPREFVPDVSTKVVEKRKAIPLDTNEGVYVRNITTGQVRSVIGKSYMLTAKEELWNKELPQEVEELLAKQLYGQTYVPPPHHGGGSKRGGDAVPSTTPDQHARDKTRVVQFRVPNNAACQVFDFTKKTSRVVVGPDMVILASDEQFTLVRLSGDTPKRPNVICSLAMLLGPDFMTDIVTVETSDHARLRVQLAYNWVFRCDRTSQSDLSKCFDVRDFVGESCKALASRIRGAVALETFDRFHKHSAKIIRGSIFGIGADGKVGEDLRFPANNLCITNVDIQAVEPVDASLLENLQKSVQLAIEITTNSQEAKARHDAHREEAQAEGLLERQKLDNESEAEAARKRLLELRAESKAVETAGIATAEARARKEAARIENEGLVAAAKLQAEALGIKRKAELDALVAEQNQKMDHGKKVAELEIQKARELADIEAGKFQRLVQAIGAETIADIARAGPEMQAKLLGSLGLKSVLLTDGRSPVNLFNAATGLIGASPQGSPSLPASGTNNAMVDSGVLM